MKISDHTKVCSHCEANVGGDSTFCPYCGSDLIEPETQIFADPSVEESLASLYKPPYSIRNKQGVGIPDEREIPPEPLPPEPTNFLNEPTVEKLPEEPKKKGFWPILFLSLGANLVTLGTLLLLFSTDGKLNLEWSQKGWYAYLLLGLPLAFFGWRKLSPHSESEN